MLVHLPMRVMWAMAANPTPIKGADLTMPLIGRKYTHKLSHFNITRSYLHVAEVLKLFSRSHKSNITWQKSAAPPPDISCSHSVFLGFLIRGFSDLGSLKMRM